jgi:medium-chain acyl-[acyl-carrier-protein] hydrolase
MEPLMDAMDRELRPWMETPYAIFGHSMGALIAFEWARRLQHGGHPMPECIFVSGRRAPGSPESLNFPQSLSDRDFVVQLTRHYNGIPPEFLDNAALMDVFLPILRADISIVESYSFREDEPLNCPISAFAGAQDQSVSWDRLFAWKRHTRSRFQMQIVPGGHFFSHRPMLHTIATTLARLLPHLPG